MELGWPQLSYIVLTAVGLGVTMVKHGEPSKTNIWVTLFASVFVYFLLIKGGFFG